MTTFHSGGGGNSLTSGHYSFSGHPEVPEAQQHIRAFWNFTGHSKALAEGSQKVNEMLKQVQHDRNTFPRPLGRGIKREGQGCDKTVSEAHRKFLVPYCLSNLVSSKKAAFTLAEVLITLAIIGVVAAMTIPTLISNFQQKALDNQFKKIYAMLNQNLLKVQGDIGYTPKCYSLGANSGFVFDECDEFKEKFIGSLKVSKICDNKAFENGCIPEYNGFDTVVKDKHKNDEDYDEDYWQDYANRNCGSFNQSEILNNKKVYVLSDGTILFFYNEDYKYNHIITVDVNGMNKPNKWGHDLFVFTINFQNNNYKFRPGGCMLEEEGGYSTTAMLDRLFSSR